MATDNEQAIGRAVSGCRFLCLTGPESAGKTTLANALGEALGLPVVPEAARQYLEGRVSYSADDLLRIAHQQVALEVQAMQQGTGLIICDTDLLVIQVWWEEKFGPIPHSLCELIKAQSERAYLLLKPDVLWAPDPLRENPTDRERLFARYLCLLESGDHPYRVIEGLGERRVAKARAAVRQMFADRDQITGRER